MSVRNTSVVDRTAGAAGMVVVITGASAGVGRATARLSAGMGARVGLMARGQTGLEALLTDVELKDSQATAIQVDVSDMPQVEHAASRIEETLGPIDIWVNNAMVTVLAPFRDIGPDEFQRVTDVTYQGVVHGTRAALGRMTERGQGSIVQVGSALAYRGIPLQSAY